MSWGRSTHRQLHEPCTDARPIEELFRRILFLASGQAARRSVHSFGNEVKSLALKRAVGMSGYESKIHRSLRASPSRWLRMATCSGSEFPLPTVSRMHI